LSEAIKTDLQVLQGVNEAIKADTTSLVDTLPEVQNQILTIHDSQHLQLDSLKLQQLQVATDWLSPTNFLAQHHDIISRKQEGTGQWLLDSPEFIGWLQGLHRTLFCPGIPGAGKTMAAAIAIDHLCNTAPADVGVAYLFCNYKSQAEQSVQNLLSTLLQQLVHSRLGIATPVKELYDRCLTRNSKPSLDEISAVLEKVCSNYSRVYIVTDALDECSDKNNCRSQLIERLRELQMRADVQLLFTSRFIPEVTDKFLSDPVLEVQANEEDLRRFVAGQLPRLPNCIRRDDALTRVVQSRIVQAVGGMLVFLYIQVYKSL
jgi:hypothetical protein